MGMRAEGFWAKQTGGPRRPQSVSRQRFPKKDNPTPASDAGQSILGSLFMV
jgi:hypothetical protein